MGLTRNGLPLTSDQQIDACAGLGAAMTTDIFPASTYEGQVATHCVLPSATNSTNKQYMGITAHMMRSSVKSLKVTFPNFYIPSNGTSSEFETGIGAAATIKAAIEYPIGTITPVTFSGVRNGSIPNLSMLTSDAVNITIPKDAMFYVRFYYTNTAGILFTGFTNFLACNSALGESVVYGVSGVADIVDGGTPAANTGSGWFVYGPCAITGTTHQASVALLGDSRVQGVGDIITGNFDIGSLARSIGPKLPYINMGISADRAMYFLTGCTNRIALSGFCSHVVLQHGFNDVTSGSRSLAQVQADLASIKALLPAGKPVWLTTKEPQTSSTDNWATTANQTANGANSVRVSLNNWIRGRPAGYAGYFEIADQIESARDSGLWTPGLTADGIHENQPGYLLLKNNEAINPAVFNRA